MRISTQRLFNKNILISTLLASLLAGMSLHSAAFDFEGALKDAVKKTD